MKISIVIPTFNRKDMLREVLYALRNDNVSNSAADIEIIVADDLSTDGTRDMVADEFPEVILVSGPGKSCTMARRAAIEASHGEYLVDIDDDALPSPGWIKEVLPDLIRGEKIVQAKVVFLDLGQENLENESTKSFRVGFKLNMYPDAVTYGGRTPQYIHNCQEIGLFISREVLSRISFDDPNLTIDFGEASSFYIRAHSLGYRVFFQPHCLINHYGATMGGCKERDNKVAPRKKVTIYTTGMVHNFFLFARMYKPLRIPYMIAYYFSAGIYLSIQQRKFCLPYFLNGIIGGLRAKFIPMNSYNWKE